MALTFWQLPDSIKTLIFEYDDTYQQKMKKIVLDNIWQASWSRYYRHLDCEYSRLVFDYLFGVWGVHRCEPFATSYLWRKEVTFLENIRVVINYGNGFLLGNLGTSIKVMDGPLCLFDGWVLDEYEEREIVSLDNRVLDALHAADVYWNHDGKLFLWQKQ